MVDMQGLADLIVDNQEYLVTRTLSFAHQYGYAQYTSPKAQEWSVSIAGLSQALIHAMSRNPVAPEADAGSDYQNKEIASFGVAEARKHRARGVSLDMFLGLMKYYRQAYLDLVTQRVAGQEERHAYHYWICRFFDLNEIGFCSEWASLPGPMKISELQASNLQARNEKSKYLTVFESISTPAILLDQENRCVNMNIAAQELLSGTVQSSSYEYSSAARTYYSDIRETLPWLREEFETFCSCCIAEITVEKTYHSAVRGCRDLIVRFRRMLDVDGNPSGTVILMDDITDRKIIESQLRFLSFHDALTGLFNRAYLNEELLKLSTGRFNPVAFIAADVDGLKLVNDRLGHAQGDELLITVSRILKNCFRQSDVIARSGGDEFLVILPSCDEQTVQHARVRIDDMVKEHNSSNASFPVSVSVGWALGDAREDGIHELICLADERMYTDKKAKSPGYLDLLNRMLVGETAASLGAG